MARHSSSAVNRCLSLLLVPTMAFAPIAAQAQGRIGPQTNHIETNIDEIMAGANGDSSIQFVEMSFGGCSQNLWGPGSGETASRAMLVFYDAAGNETYRFKFPNDPPCGNNKVLIATSGFAALSGAPTPNFTIPAKLSPEAGKVCFKNNPENTHFSRNECVSYGAFTGNTESADINNGSGSFGPPTSALPIVNTVSLTRSSPDSLNSSFTLSTTPTPINHAGATMTIPVASQVVQGENLFTKETFGGNGRTCASCHVSSLGLGLTPANIQSRFATVGTSFDPLFLGETNFNLNTLTVTGPSSGKEPSTNVQVGVRDFQGIITGSGGGTAKILTKLNAEGSSTIRYLVYGGLSPALAGTISDSFGNSATFGSLTPGTLACSSLNSGINPPCTSTAEFPLEDPRRMRTSNDTTKFPEGRGLILENIDGFTNPHSNNHVFRKSPNIENAKHTAPFGLSGLTGGAATLGEFSAGAVTQHFPRTINRVSGTDFRPPTVDEKAAMNAFQQSLNVPADENFNLDLFATTQAQKAGRVAFFGSAKCSKCHSGPVLADTDGTISGKTGNANFNTGVDALSINVSTDLLPTEDSGLREFNTPALFNAKNHAPFFHNGAVATLREAVEFYSTVAFQNSPAFAESGSLVLTGQQVDDITAFLEGLTPRTYSLSGGPLSFGSQGTAAGATTTQQVTITNTGSTALTLTSPFVRLAGTDSSQFTISSHTLTGTLGSGASAQVNVAFDPSSGGAKTAVLEFLAETPSGVDVSGTGVAAAPSITNVSPATGPTTGGHSVTVTGTNLSGATITIGGTAATVTASSDTSLTFTTPAHSAGTVDVVATTGGGTATATGAYTYVVPAITVTPTSGLTTTEAGGTATFTVFLATQPLADVTIGLSSADLSEGTVSPVSITFTSSNWNSAQTATVRGVDDSLADGAVPYTIATAAASSSDSAYNAMNASDVSVTNSDNDGVGITVSPASGLVTIEGGLTASFAIRLASEPTANVTIALTSSDTTEGSVSPGSVTFTSSNWYASQLVTISGIDDGDGDGSVGYTIITAAATSADGMYNGVNAADVSVTNLDNDTANEAIVAGVTLVKAQHILELRSSINALRLSVGLAEAVFTDSSLRGVQMKGVHVTELRTALDAARQILGRSTGGYTDATLTPGATGIKAVHIQELRDRVNG